MCIDSNRNMPNTSINHKTETRNSDINEESRKSKLMQASHLVKNVDDYIEIFNIASSNDSFAN